MIASRMRDWEPCNAQTIDWLLDGDPAARLAVMRDLLDADAPSLAHEQSRIADSGWGARLLERQDATGTWSGALYSPKYTSTHYTLLTLRRLGLSPDHPGARKAAHVLLDAGTRADHGINFTSQHGARSETCISGMCLSMFSYFGLRDARVALLAEHMLAEQMPDGGWNCRRHRGATHGSFTTTSALEGLLDFHVTHTGHGLPVAEALVRGREFLLQHRLYRSHRTGEVMSASMTRFPFPPMWQHDVCGPSSTSPQPQHLATTACGTRSSWSSASAMPTGATRSTSARAASTTSGTRRWAGLVG